MFLTEKRNQKIKGHTIYNGKPTREWHDKRGRGKSDSFT
jgi:hypothetical protein